MPDAYEGQLRASASLADRYLAAKIERLERANERLEARVTALEAAALLPAPQPRLAGCRYNAGTDRRHCGAAARPSGLCAKHEGAG
jgi:hypothetical protein